MAPAYLSTKLYIPVQRPGLVSRPRLIERLDSGLKGKLTLVSAPAGYGKSTVVSSWLAWEANHARGLADQRLAIANQQKTVAAAFQELLASLREELAPFKVDCRLRPEGKSSQLVWGINKYGEYLDSRARIWEFQSLQKLKLPFIQIYLI